jgi:ParB family chromosome partitioning protein
MDVDDRAVAEIALIENMQRKDLTAWEEADGLAALCERFSYTHDEVARKVGKSRITVTESLSIATLPFEIREQCRRADIASKSILLQLARQPDIGSIQSLLGEIIRKGLKRDGARAVRRAQVKRELVATDEEAASESPYIYKFEAEIGTGYKIEVIFGRTHVSREEIINALLSAINSLQNQNVHVNLCADD